MGFEDDLNRIFDALGISQADLARKMEVSPAYVSQVLNGQKRNLQLETMVRFSRAVGSILQISLVKEGKEVARVLDYETAALVDGLSDRGRARAQAASPPPASSGDNILPFPDGARFIMVDADVKGSAASG